jgi:hypothetical protein
MCGLTGASEPGNRIRAGGLQSTSRGCRSCLGRAIETRTALSKLILKINALSLIKLTTETHSAHR